MEKDKQKRRVDPFGADLKRLKDNMDFRNFQALSMGMGIGGASRVDASNLRPPTAGTNYAHPTPKVTPHTQEFAPVPVAGIVSRALKSQREQLPTQPVPQMNQAPMVPMQPVAVGPTQAQQVSAPPKAPGFLVQMWRAVTTAIFWTASGILRWIAVHAVDLVAVASCLAVALIFAGLVFAPNSDGHVAKAFLEWVPIKMLLKMSLLGFIALLYGIFFVYWMFFRFVAGQTLGQAFLGARRKSANPPH